MRLALTGFMVRSMTMMMRISATTHQMDWLRRMHHDTVGMSPMATLGGKKGSTCRSPDSLDGQTISNLTHVLANTT
jgi:hypothetical protein